MRKPLRARALRALVTFAVVVVLGSVSLAVCVAALVPSVRQLSIGTVASASELPELLPLAQRSEIFTRDGHLMTTLFSVEDRDPVSLAKIPEPVIQAVLAIEDRSFYQHNGVDLKGTVRALVKDFGSGKSLQGGSTITQQLVKNTLIAKPQKNVARKLREAMLALRLEQEYTKDQILERYLNTVYFGRGAYGIKAAAERYFDAQPQQLGVAEAALLAGMISNPGGYDPIEHPVAARTRRAEVLDAMVETGALTQAQADAQKDASLPAAAHQLAKFAPDNYFIAAVVESLLNDSRLGRTRTEREHRLYSGGLRVTTTFDGAQQALAELAIRNIIPKGKFTGALVAIDNRNGQVRAMVGGVDFRTSQFDLARGANRQPGSTFKAFDLAAALEAGYSPKDAINATSPCRFDPPLATSHWEIKSTHGGGSGMRLSEAMAQSINCAFARLVMSLGAGAVGPQTVANLAHRLGVRSELAPNSSIAIGTEGVSPLDLASAYSTFADEGIHHPPVLVTKVEDSAGNVLFEDRGKSEPVLDPEVARTMTKVLQGVVDHGTGTSAKLGRPVAGKTGTTDDNADAWFVGYTPQLTTAVWMGDPAARTPMDNVGGIAVFGGTYPAKVFAAFMREALKSQPVMQFTAPDEKQWPSAQYIDEKGRRFTGGSRSTTTTSSAPVVTTPKSTTTTSAVPTSTTSVPPTSVPGAAPVGAAPGDPGKRRR